MIVRVSFNELNNAMDTIESVVNDKLLQEDLKNVVFWIKDGELRFVATNGNIVTSIDVDGQVEGVEGETFVQLKAKDIVDVLSSFKSLKRTKVKLVEFHISENDAQMHVIEEPLDEDMQFASIFNQVTRFRVTMTRVKEFVKREVQLIDPNVEGVDLNREDLLLYINSLLPIVAKETRDSISSVYFGQDYIYVILPSWLAYMPNKLHSAFNNFKLSNTVVNFLKNFISDYPSVVFAKEDKENDLVLLTFKTDKAIAVIKCANLRRSPDISQHITVPENGMILDKLYLIDVLKRLNLTNEAVFLEVNIDTGQFRVVSKNMMQNIPVLKTRGTGEYNFSIRADVLANLIFSHATQFNDLVYMYLGKEDGKINIVCADNTQLWFARMTGLTTVKSNFAW